MPLCGEELGRPVSRRRERRRTREPVADELIAVDFALCVCFPLGCIVAIIAIATEGVGSLFQVGVTSVMTSFHNPTSNDHLADLKKTPDPVTTELMPPKPCPRIVA